jgi:hypothetical protein
MKFAVPPTEFLGVYNMGDDSVRPMAQNWFHYKSQQVKKNNKKFSSFQLVEWYPIFAALANLLLLIHLAGLICFGQFKLSQTGTRLLLIVVALWLMNSAFSIFASPIVLRYQVFPILLSFCLALLAGEKIYSSTSSNKNIAI